MNRHSIAALSLLSVTACAKPPEPAPDEAAIRTAISAEMQKIMPAFAAKDVAAVTKFFTDDATWILPDATTFTGRANIEAGAKAFFGSFESATAVDMKLDRLIVVSDTEAVTFAHGTFSMTMKGKKPENHVNPFADQWKKGADGVWRIAYEVNAEGLVPAAPAK